MKKILAFIFAVSVISTAAFSKNFFSQRYVEMKVGAEAGFSNNIFAANEYLKKDLIIDLQKIANDCPENGFNIRTDANTSFAVNVNIKDIHVGFSSGIELYESFELGKDLFDFLGYGNKVGENINLDFRNDADLFAVSQFDFGFKLGKLKINAQPALFLPLISIRGAGGTINAVSDEDGNMSVSMDVKMDVFSASELKKQDDSITFDEEKIKSTILAGYGFDLGGGVGYILSDSFIVGANCRIPVFPGRLYNKATVEGGFMYKLNLQDHEKCDQDSKETTVSNTESTLFVHRPLKLDIYADKNLLGNLFNVRAGAGFGIRRPYSTYAVFYPEYYLGVTLNLIDVFKLGVSTQYRDQVFIHQIGTTINVRIIQLDFGVSTQSSSFKKSMAFGGVGGYAYVTVGF